MILEQFGLDDKVAIVTGSAQGLGQGIAQGLAEAGADIALVDVLDTSETQKRVEALGRRCVGIRADLSDKACVPTIVDTTVQKLGGVDILINNAGIIRRAPITEFTEKDWDDVMNVNIRTLFFLSQAVGKVMISSPSIRLRMLGNSAIARPQARTTTSLTLQGCFAFAER